jgi:NAD(P)H-hydrate epimerase
MQALSREQVRNLDRIAVERYGIPGLILMENAGRGATDSLFRLLENLPERPVFVVVAGRGNNGGDGFVIARHLVNRGFEVNVAILGEPERFRGPGDAGVNFGIAERMGIPIFPVASPEELLPHLAGAHVAVDAILGTGLSGEVRGLALDAIDALNALSRPVLAVDTPSGLDCDTGKPLGAAVHAEATVTFAAMKKGFLEPGADAYTGPVEVVDIGCPMEWE